MRDQDFRDLMAGVCSPVTVVTTADEQGPHGATVSSFASLSLDPPLVTLALDRRASLLARILATNRFGVNVLGSRHDELAMAFARRGTDRFRGVGWASSQGLPRLTGTSGWAACDLQETVAGGDHLLLIGRVTHCESTPLSSPLVYGHRVFGTHSRFVERPCVAIVDTIAAYAR